MVLVNVVFIVALKRLVPELRIWRRVRAAILAAVVVAWVGIRWLSGWATTPYSFAACALLAAAFFAAVIAVVDRKAFNDAISIFRGKQLAD
jgi:hypothetical protein